MPYTFNQQFEIASPTGATLNIYHTPSRNGRATVHINHGLAEHAARYGRFATALADAGFHVYAHDHRGHGHTKAPDAPAGVFSTDGDGRHKVIADTEAVHSYIRQQHPDQPRISFGHSMGAMIAMNHALAHPASLNGAAIWNTSFEGGLAAHAARFLLGWERFRRGSDAESRIMPALSFTPWGKSIKDRRTEFDWLSHIPEEVDAYIADPLCGWGASISMWRDVVDLIEGGAKVRAASTEAKTLSFHLAAGGEDPASNYGKAMRRQAERMRRAGFREVAFHQFDDARHETLNDTMAGEATDLFIAWALHVAG